MFGSDLILGKKVCKIEAKNRIVLPKFTFAEKDDILAFISVDSDGTFDIVELEKLKKHLLDLDEQRKLEKTLIKKAADYKLLDQITDSIMGYNTVDKQRRITIPQNDINNIYINKSILITGKVYNNTNYIKCKVV